MCWWYHIQQLRQQHSLHMCCPSDAGGAVVGAVLSLAVRRMHPDTHAASKGNAGCAILGSGIAVAGTVVVGACSMT